MKIGIRKEDKSVWERRVPFVPADIRALREEGLDIAVQASDQRAFSDEEFSREGIPVQDDLEDCDLIFGIKEIPKAVFEAGKQYVFFSHVIKGQPCNMPMLKRMMEQGVTLFDYERIVDEQNRRLIFFGRHAGLAGMINSLWALGKRLEAEEIPNPFGVLRQARDYHDLAEAKAGIQAVGKMIREQGLPAAIHPLIVGITGYGNVSKGAQEILDLLPVREIQPEEVSAVAADLLSPKKAVFKVVFREEHCVRPKDPDAAFDLQDYYKNGREKYDSCFEPHLKHLSLLVNCIYWDDRYPRLITLETCQQMWAGGKFPGLRVIGDISCDPGGAIQCTVASTDPGNPVYVYLPETGERQDGFEGHGPVIMAVDILPTEIPRESSVYFSSVLKGFIRNFAEADFTVPFEALNVLPELKRSVILYQGRLTPDYGYLRKYL
ncbi:hypothetical protein DENIS_1263 [Desulfonema ishimotonii]|uniref:Alanine dehydrogenase/pyridine nucleotide transhydrogenase N-terminal domain-containing protein n=1 Tax=Desulfonema ishimotonii TaxID=45657 RepID=A0A401FTL2_9BACT|nr:hypothetical protein [Desulfonema ishimotonii]GBC60312.1 hypothetical protein DENIS_1263 [Desulfonema ishimotonii]